MDVSEVFYADDQKFFCIFPENTKSVVTQVCLLGAKWERVPFRCGQFLTEKKQKQTYIVSYMEFSVIQ